MKKMSVILIVVMLLNAFALPVFSASLTNLFSSSTLAWCNWTAGTPYLLDGDSTTYINLGTHSLGGKGIITFKVSDDGTVKYNKMKIDVVRYNTALVTISSSNSLNGTEPTASGEAATSLSDATVMCTYTPTETVSSTATTLALSFDSTTNKYVQFKTEVADASALGFRASAMYLYYATPSSMEIGTLPSFAAGSGGTFTATANIYDADGDVLNDSTLNGVTWSVNSDAEGVTVDAETGKVTVLASAPVQTVTVTAISTSKTSLKASKTFEIEPAGLENLFSASTLSWSNWTAGSSYLLDEDATTYINMGQHTAGSNGIVTFKVSDDASVKYNKLKIDVKRYNTDPLVINSGTALDGTEPTASSKSTVAITSPNRLYTHTPPLTVGDSEETITLSFDSTTNNYLEVISTVVDSTVSGFQAYAMYLYYATPVKVNITSAIPNFVYSEGGTYNTLAEVLDSDGDVIKDTTLNELKWSVNASASGVSIDEKTGKITISPDAPVQTVTVRAELSSNPDLHATKAFKITSPSLKNLFTSSTVVWSPWSGTMTSNLVDGDDTTFYNAGEHTAGSDGRVVFKVSDDNSVKYNKVSIDITRFNSTAFALSSSDTLNGTEPETNTTSSVNLSSATTIISDTLVDARTDVTSETIRYTFDTTDDKYLRFENTVAEGSPTYGIRITEFELYYATPAKIDVALSKLRILAGTAETITASAVVKDAQGDILTDSTLNGIVWSINEDAEGVTIDSETGAIQVSENAPIQEITVTATSTADGFSGILGSKVLKISDTAEPSFAERVEEGVITEVSLDVAQDNNTVAAMLSFTSSEQVEAPYMVILALYDSNDELIGLEIKQQSTVNSGRTVTKASRAMSSEYKKVKVYAWDEKLSPLSVVKEHTVKTIDSIKILSIGNSWSEDATRHIYKILEDMGIDNIIVAHCHIGGSTLELHWTNANNNKAAYTYMKNSTGTWVNTANSTMLSAIQDEDWDFISLQQSAKCAGIASTYEPYFSNLIDYINKNKTNSNAKLVFHLTWAFPSYSTKTYFAQYDNDQMTMYNAHVNVAKTVVIPTSKFSVIMPAGTAIQNLRSSYVGDTVNRDESHLSYNTGRYTAGMMWVKSLTGMSIDNVTYVPSSTEITESRLDIIKKSVNAAYKTPYSVTQIGTGVDDGITNN